MRPTLLLALIFALALTGCQRETPREQEVDTRTGAPEPKAGEAPATSASEGEQAAPEAIAGREAVHRMMALARLWAPDAQPASAQSEPSAEAYTREGKATEWRGIFVSQSRGEIRPYQFSATGEDRVRPGNIDRWNPGNVATRPFDLNFLKVGSDRAFEVAQKRGGEKLLARNKELPVLFRMEWDPRQNGLFWHVIYGESERAARLHVVVNASTGEYARTAK